MAANKQKRIADELRSEIGRGVLKPGARLPSEAELISRFDVSRVTVRAALATLANEGLIIGRVGSGHYVRERVVLTHYAARAEWRDGRGETDAYVAEVRAEDRVPSQDFRMQVEPADQSVATRLRVDEGELVVARYCFRYVDGQPWSDQVSYYPMDVSQDAGLLTPADIPEGTIRAMARAGHVEIGSREEITSRMPTPDQAQRLDMDRGVPLMVYIKTAWTDRRPVRMTRTLFPSDRNRLVYELGDLSGMNAEPV